MLLSHACSMSRVNQVDIHSLTKETKHWFTKHQDNDDLQYDYKVECTNLAGVYQHLCKTYH